MFHFHLLHHFCFFFLLQSLLAAYFRTGGRVGPPGPAAYAAAKFGVVGFSESLSKEVGPLGIKVTIVEPGGFRTDFAGSSRELREGRREYDATVGATVRFQRDYDAKQPGDPIKAAGPSYILHRYPNRRCGCYWEVTLTTRRRNTQPKPWRLTEWKDLSISTNGRSTQGDEISADIRKGNDDLSMRFT